MKAKEYAKLYEAADDKLEAIGDIGLRFLKEIETIAEQRKASTDSAMVAIVREQDQKWRAFARQANDVQSGVSILLDGFAVMIKTEFPDIYRDLCILGWEPKSD